MILACHNLEKSFGDQVIVRHGSFHIEDHEKAALTGLNGAGKSTILKMITGELPSDSGEIILAKGKQIGYLSQHPMTDSTRTIYEELRTSRQYLVDLENQIRKTEAELESLSGDALTEKLSSYHKMTSRFERENGYAYESEITGVLKGLGFTEEEFLKPVSSLSGGQRTRVSLGKLLLTKPDILLLDEPTNHLDMASKEILEHALNDYTGTVLYVSHDRYFINRTATRILELVNQKFVNYIGNYDYYLEKKEELTAVYAAPAPEATAEKETPLSSGKLDWKAQKEAQARERKRQNDLRRTEETIEKLEGRSEEIDHLMTREDVYSNSVRCQELAKEKDEITARLETLYEQWETLAEDPEN